MKENNTSNLNVKRTIIAIITGLIGAVGVWVLHPLNNFLLNNSFIADHFLPELAICFVIILIILVNPLLRMIGEKYAFNFRQLALIFGILLVSATIGPMFRCIPHAVARANLRACEDAKLAKLHKKMDLPESLYVEPVEYGKEALLVKQFHDQLRPGNEIPWNSWVPPLLSWGVMLGSAWLLMIGLGLIVFPQWRDNERLAFPLLAVQRELIETPESGRKFPPLFYKKIFWAGCILVFILHSFNGLSHHTHNSFPVFPLNWNLFNAFSDGIIRHATSSLKSGRIYFMLVGITFFMPNRISFSIWFTFIASQLYRMVGYEYLAPFHYETVNYQSFGAMFSFGFIIIWLGRKHWKEVIKAMVLPSKCDENIRDRTAGWLFTLGGLILFCWQIWTGVQVFWALVMVFIVTMCSLTLARIVCETGIPFIATFFGPTFTLRMFSAKLMNLNTVYITGFLNIVVRAASRTSACVFAVHGYAIDKDNKPKTTARLAYLFIVVLLLGILICGATHIVMSYNFSGSLDGSRVPIAMWGSRQAIVVQNEISSLDRGVWSEKPFSVWGHFSFGAVLAAILQIACLFSPKWPLHPVGLLMMGSWYHGIVWYSIFLGWSIKVIMVKFGGAQAYRIAKPFFLGLIIGEMLAAIFWAAVPATLIMMGYDPTDVGHIVILPQ